MSDVLDRRHLRWAKKYPELGSGALPTDVFSSEDHFLLEVDKIFRRVWLQVGRVEEIPNPGDYKVRRLPFAHTSAILIRGNDGAIRAFHNTCSHRGNKPITEAGFDTFGHARSGHFECWFHGWVYDGQGRLVHVPEEDRFPECFARAENGLTPIACDLWEGFVFINLDREPPQTLGEFLGGFGKHLAGYPYHALTQLYRYQTIVRCNWKVALDAFSESYHVPYLHRYLWPGRFGTTLEAIQFFGPHRTSEVWLDPDPSVGSVAAVANAIMSNSLGQVRTRQSMLPAQINPGKRPDFAFELSACFPNFMIHIGEGTYFTHNFYPLDAHSIMWEGSSYVAAPRTQKEQFSVVYAEKMQILNWLEDSATMEMTQESLESGAKDKFWLHDEEVLIRHSHKVIADYLNRP